MKERREKGGNKHYRIIVSKIISPIMKAKFPHSYVAHFKPSHSVLVQFLPHIFHPKLAVEFFLKKLLAQNFSK